MMDEQKTEAEILKEQEALVEHYIQERIKGKLQEVKETIMKQKFNIAFGDENIVVVRVDRIENSFDQLSNDLTK